ncbi:MAG: hypothetical protein ACTSW4_05395 [Candidatus Ranarchaeia archaeon]
MPKPAIKMCMIWIGMDHKKENGKRFFYVEVSIPDSVEPPIDYIFSGKIDESERRVFHSPLRSDKIQLVADEGERIMLELRNKGAHVVFVQEIHLSHPK